ncbi:transposase [Cerasicoccus maritimus]|uniref:transposase n=1 Tax=Cerasicoccus maritimus TaxID=490089 RepID=UPI002852824E|nr:transposase [Cerasicoccus maritimus]
MEIPEVEVVADGVVRDSRGRRHRPKSERERLARESFETSLSLVEFARREGLNYHTLIGWRYDLKRRAESPEPRSKAAKSESLQFAEFRLPVPSSKLEVYLPDGTLLRGDTAAELSALAKALRC